jgi:hypothetical protein
MAADFNFCLPIEGRRHAEHAKHLARSGDHYEVRSRRFCGRGLCLWQQKRIPRAITLRFEMTRPNSFLF